MSTHPLPFVRDLPEPGPNGRTHHFWSPPCEGLDYTAACDLGTELAFEAVQYVRAKNIADLLGWAVMDMPATRAPATPTRA